MSGPSLHEALLGGAFDFRTGESMDNPPGRDHLDFRLGTFESFVVQILDDLMRTDTSEGVLASPPTEILTPPQALASLAGPGSVTGAPEGDANRPLRIRFNLTDNDNWLVSLVRAWATVCDILTFYQERIANEGYLRTARETLSRYELARMINYRPRPGVGGSLQAAFMASELDRLPQKVRIAPRTKLHANSPDGDTLIFETSRPLLARAEWNQIVPVAAEETRAAVLLGEALHVDLRGADTGLAPGAAVVLATFSQRPVRRPIRVWVRLLTGVEVLTDGEPRTRVTWSGALDEDQHAEFAGVNLFALRYEGWLFGANAPPWESLPLERQRTLRPIQGGVRLLEPPAPWRSINEELPTSPVRCMAFDGQGTLYAGTSGAGVFRRRPDDGVWRSADRGLQQTEVSTLAVDPRGAILAGTGDGDIYRSTDQGAIWTLITGKGTRAAMGWSLPSRRSRKRLGRLPETAIRSLWATSGGRVSHLFAGTDTGIYFSADLGSTWRPMNKGLPGVDGETGETDLVVETLVGVGDALYAATGAGVFRSGNGGRKWRSISFGLPETDPITGVSEQGVLALAAYRDERLAREFLVVSIPGGVFRSENGGEDWEEVDGLPDEVDHLAVLNDPITVTLQLFAGSAQGLWRSKDHGRTWEPVSLGDAVSRQVAAITASPAAGALAVASPLGGFAEEEWPHFHLTGGKIDLATIVPNIAEKGWVALVPEEDEGGDGPGAVAYEIEKVSIVRRRDFDVDTTITRLHVTADPDLQRYDLRATRVFVQSEPLRVMPRVMPPDPFLALTSVSAALRTMDADRPIIVTGVVVPERVREKEEADDGGDEGHDDRPGSPTYVHFTTAGKLLRELVEQIEKAEDAVQPLSLPERGPMVRSDRVAQERTVQVDPRTVRIWGNTGEATEGTTIYNEILGDGDASQALQRFTLAFPLAFDHGSPPRSTLSVRVQGVEWTEVRSLFGHGPESRVYKVELDHEGTATVVFGDGNNGARLPSGRDNVVATYRTGMSSRRAVAGTVTLIGNPVGLSRVNNPIAGTPGAPPESRHEIWRRARRHLKTLNRIVSLDDYENFAATYPGFVKAKAERVVTPGAAVIHVTVARQGEEQRVESPADDGTRGLLKKLLGAMDEARSGFDPVQVQPFKARFFIVQAEIRIRQGFPWDDVEGRALEKLRQRFGFRRSEFGGRVHRAEVIQTLQGVEGVAAVDLNVLRTVTDLSLQLNLAEALVPADGRRWEEIEGDFRAWLRDEVRDPSRAFVTHDELVELLREFDRVDDVRRAVVGKLYRDFDVQRLVDPKGRRELAGERLLKEALRRTPDLTWEDARARVHETLRALQENRLQSGDMSYPPLDDLVTVLREVPGVIDVERTLLAGLYERLHIQRILDGEDQLTARGAAWDGQKILPAEMLILDLDERLEKRLVTRLKPREDVA